MGVMARKAQEGQGGHLFVAKKGRWANSDTWKFMASTSPLPSPEPKRGRTCNATLPYGGSPNMVSKKALGRAGGKKPFTGVPDHLGKSHNQRS